jgi:hypothetical protein
MVERLKELERSFEGRAWSWTTAVRDQLVGSLPPAEGTDLDQSELQRLADKARCIGYAWYAHLRPKTQHDWLVRITVYVWLVLAIVETTAYCLA